MNQTSGGASASPDTDTTTSPPKVEQLWTVSRLADTDIFFVLATPQAKAPSVANRELSQNCQNVARFRELSRKTHSRNGTETWRRPPRGTAGFAELRGTRDQLLALPEAKAAARQKPALRFRSRSRFITMNERMPILASSHRHVTDVGSTCC